MPNKGKIVYVEGYGGGLYVGADFSDETEDVVMLKFEGTVDGHNVDEGYGQGIISIPYDEWKENRVYPEQVADGEPIVKSTEKREKAFEERFA